MTTTSSQNHSGWSNADYDRLVALAGQETNPSARLELLRQAETILLTEVPIIPIYTYTRVALAKPNIRGYHQNLQDVHPMKWMYKE